MRPELQNQLDSMIKNAGLDRKQAMPNTPPPGTDKSIHIGDGNRRERLLPAVARPKWTPGTPKRGDDNALWYDSPGTKMKPDTAKYADTGEAPEIQKRQGNLLKWMKANATKRKEFDQDMANK